LAFANEAIVISAGANTEEAANWKRRWKTKGEVKCATSVFV